MTNRSAISSVSPSGVSSEPLAPTHCCCDDRGMTGVAPISFDGCARSEPNPDQDARICQSCASDARSRREHHARTGALASFDRRAGAATTPEEPARVGQFSSGHLRPNNESQGSVEVTR